MATTASAATSDKLVKFSFVLALKFPLSGTGYAEYESRGTVDIQPGTSRHQVFEQVRSNLVNKARSQGLTDDATTVFWTLEPDTL